MTDSTKTLSARVESITADLVVVSYRVENRRKGPLYVFSLLYETDALGNRTLDEGLAYTYLDGNAFKVGKFLVEIPRGMKVESPVMPYLDPIGPGEAASGQVRIPLPARRFHPYYPIATEGVIQDGSTVTFVIGVLDPARAARKEALVAQAHGSGEGHFRCDYGLGLRYQELMEVPLTVPGFRYFTGDPSPAPGGK